MTAVETLPTTYEELMVTLDLPEAVTPMEQRRVLQARRVELLEDQRACLNGEIVSYKLRRFAQLGCEIVLVEDFLAARGWPKENHEEGGDE